ncbi:GNAT family N-acetyltransferase [Frigidibacter mobilis]|uniref:GNAT family N-acetyltransferase n=1 Tax=Frigidibacter mobilis TaxID=1335048 RepID=UPI00083098AA|nr:GNAT family N-acetyltransferase [Frigidibacter mobilis]
MRKAHRGDLAAIQSILNAPGNLDKLADHAESALLAAMTSDDQAVMVLDLPDAGVAAFLWITGQSSSAPGPKIEEFGDVQPGSGHGAELLDRVVQDHMARHPTRPLWLAVAADNTRAIAFYERRGFRQTELRPAAWHRRSSPVADALVMQMEAAAAPQLTPNEAKVLSLLRMSNTPMTAYQLLDRMQQGGGVAAPPTVYRALKGLEDTGLVRRIETLRAWVPLTSPAPGVVAICDDCGSVRNLATPDLFDSLHLRLAAEGFAEARRTIEVRGRCGDCAASKA